MCCSGGIIPILMPNEAKTDFWTITCKSKFYIFLNMRVAELEPDHRKGCGQIIFLKLKGVLLVERRSEVTCAEIKEFYELPFRPKVTELCFAPTEAKTSFVNHDALICQLR